MKRYFLLFLLPAFIACAGTQGVRPAASGGEVKTTFQTAAPWSAAVDNHTDAVLVYGVNGDSTRGTAFEQRVESWRAHDYYVQFMAGIAWGGFQDYFYGGWDGKNHLDEGQVRAAGDTIWHGRTTPYLVPSLNFIEYYKEKVIKPVIDAGITEIFMEEPEFWADGGYSEAFKREWKEYYGEEWHPQHESPQATYMSGKLKYHLYYRTLDAVFSYAKEYGASKGMDVKCYVPTHSLVNYSMWQIVSPEASLASLPCVDGYIAQVWTGTSRVQNYYDGIRGERVFETAYLEYGCMKSMTAPTGRKMYFLTDPIEDAVRDWDDYERNYEATFTAQLLYPGIADYEVMPWPERIYKGKYRMHPADTVLQPVPRDFATRMQFMINALNTMPLSDNVISGSQGISVLMANSMMFQRFPIHDGYDDPQFSDFFGLAFPLLKRGVPVQIAHIENVQYPQTLASTRLLLMSYANMKPLEPQAHEYLAQWVRDGGTLVYCGRDEDPFQSVTEWWNVGSNAYKAPSDHLFSLLGIPEEAPDGVYTCGEGTVRIMRQDPKEFVLQKGGDASLVAAVSDLYAKACGGEELLFKNYLSLERGIYDLVAVMDESVSSDAYVQEGVFIDLYDPKLPVLTRKEVLPGRQSLMVDVSKVPDPERPQVLVSSCRIFDESVSRHSYSFTGKGPVNTSFMVRVLLPSEPSEVSVAGKKASFIWDALSHTCLLESDNQPDGVAVDIRW